MMKGRFIDVLWELDYGMRNHAYKKKHVKYIIVSPSSKPVISSGILLLVKTEEVHVIKGNNIEDKMENINHFVMPE